MTRICSVIVVSIFICSLWFQPLFRQLKTVLTNNTYIINTSVSITLNISDDNDILYDSLNTAASHQSASKLTKRRSVSRQTSHQFHSYVINIIVLQTEIRTLKEPLKWINRRSVMLVCASSILTKATGF